MNKHSVTERLAVCSWSLEPADPADLAGKVQAAGLRRVQLALDPLRQSPANWGNAPASLRGAGIELVSGMFGCLGEDYSTLESIRLTGGIAPDATWEANFANIKATAALAQQLKLKLVTFHAGFLPHEDSDPNFAKMQKRLQLVADLFQAQGLALGLETGQETAPVLRRVLEAIQRPNLKVNFDPANMILYDKGDPVAALRQLGPWIGQVHLKDARRTQVPGTWGEEVPVGAGQVPWAEFFRTLGELQFHGDLVIEREAGHQRVADIRAAKDLVERISL